MEKKYFFAKNKNRLDELEITIRSIETNRSENPNCIHPSESYLQKLKFERRACLVEIERKKSGRRNTAIHDQNVIYLRDFL